jgi:hypothetical protein
VVNFTKYNEYLGRLLGVVRRLIPEVALFFALYLINLIFFSLFAESSFINTPLNISLRKVALGDNQIKANTYTGTEMVTGFSSFNDSFKTLFYSSFGSFDFEILDKVRLGSKYGISFLILFLVVNIGLFMSLFVSIITVLYQEFSKHQNLY